MPRSIPLATIALLAACDLSLSAQEAPTVQPELPAFEVAKFANPAPNPWFPLTPGPARTYEGRNPDGETDRSVVTVQGPGPTIMGVPTVAVLDEAYEDDLRVERTLDYFAADSEGNVWYMGEDVTNYRYDEDDNLIGQDDESAWRAGEDGALPGVIMWAEPEVGRSYFEEYAPANEAMDYGRVDAVGLTLRGPAGTFTDVVKVFDGSTIETDAREYKYYAPGIGTVREEEDLDPSLANPELVVELQP